MVELALLLLLVYLCCEVYCPCWYTCLKLLCCCRCCCQRHADDSEEEEHHWNGETKLI